MANGYSDTTEASWVEIKKVLIRFDFEEVKKDSDNIIFFKRGSRLVSIPKENKLYIISLLDIIQQSEINREDFFAALKTNYN